MLHALNGVYISMRGKALGVLQCGPAVQVVREGIRQLGNINWQ